MPELDTGRLPALAVAMWDFSWLERRWSGGGYEDWDKALDELVERGYDVVRIDAFPHLIGHDHRASYTLVPAWTQPDWGSPRAITVEPFPALVDFIAATHARGLKVALSTWFREDTESVRMRLDSPARLADAWIRTLDHIRDAGLIEAIWYVDLCNEWPETAWAPFIYGADFKSRAALQRTSDEGRHWTDTALCRVRDAYPCLPLCFSIASQYPGIFGEDVRQYDLLEPHIWMVMGTERPFYNELPWRHRPEDANFDPAEIDVLAETAERLYRSDPQAWKSQLAELIARFAQWSHETSLPLVTTECWGLVVWKDGPGLDWGWLKDLCAFGVSEAVRYGRWKGIATSNFCGPQFRGMWTDVAWHRDLTDRIHGTG